MNPVQATALGVTVGVSLAIVCYYCFKKKDNSFSSSLPALPYKFLFWFHPEETIQMFLHYTETYGRLLNLQRKPVPIILVSEHEFAMFLMESSEVVTKSGRHQFCAPRLDSELTNEPVEREVPHQSVLFAFFFHRNRTSTLKITELMSNMLTSKLNARPQKTSVNIFPLVSICVLDILSECTMGLTTHAILSMLTGYQPASNSLYGLCLPIVNRKLLNEGISISNMTQLLVTNHKEYLRQVMMLLHLFLDVVVSNKIQRRNAKIQPREESENKKTYIDYLAEVSINSGFLTAQEILKQADLFLFDGAAAISTTISFVLHSLAYHPEFQNRIVWEQRRIFNGWQHGEATYSDLDRMSLLGGAIDETLRLYPPMPIIIKEAASDFYYNGRFISKGTSFHIFIFGIHRDPEYFYNPDEFDPIRFLMGDESLAFIPFSFGPSNCLGEDFAMMQMKGIISRILRKFEIVPSIPPQTDTDLMLTFNNVLSSDNGMWIGLKTREIC